MVVRKIFKNASSAQHAIRDVLAMIFTQELLVPSREIFVVAPWISNIVIFDNRIGQFDALNPEWGKREIRLVDVVIALASGGTRVLFHTRTDSHNRIFQGQLLQAASDAGVSDSYLWTQRAHLHTKGLLTDTVLLEGSMNLTERGVGLNDEAMNVCFDPDQIAAARIHFVSYEQN